MSDFDPMKLPFSVHRAIRQIVDSWRQVPPTFHERKLEGAIKVLDHAVPEMCPSELRIEWPGDETSGRPLCSELHHRPDQVAKRLREIAREYGHDPEAAGSIARNLIEDFLRYQGHRDVADAWHDVPSYY